MFIPGAHPLWPTGETFPVVVGTGELVYNRLTGPGSVSGGVAEEEGATEEGATEETAVEEGATEETAVEEGATEESAVEEGGAEGGAEEGAPETTAGGSKYILISHVSSLFTSDLISLIPGPIIIKLYFTAIVDCVAVTVM